MVPHGYIWRDVIFVLTLPYCWLLVEVLAVQRPVSTLACSSIPVRLSRRDHSSTLCWCKGMDPLPLAVEGITSISALLHSLIWGNTHFGHVILTKWHLPETEIKTYRTSVRIWCGFDRASSLICGNKMPTRCNRGFYCRSYCLLNMFQVSLCPSSGAQDYYTVVAACGILCCGFQVAGLLWSWGLCVRFFQDAVLRQHPANRTHFTSHEGELRKLFWCTNVFQCAFLSWHWLCRHTT